MPLMSGPEQIQIEVLGAEGREAPGKVLTDDLTGYMIPFGHWGQSSLDG